MSRPPIALHNLVRTHWKQYMWQPSIGEESLRHVAEQHMGVGRQQSKPSALSVPCCTQTRSVWTDNSTVLQRACSLLLWKFVAMWSIVLNTVPSLMESSVCETFRKSETFNQSDNQTIKQASNQSINQPSIQSISYTTMQGLVA